MADCLRLPSIAHSCVSNAWASLLIDRGQRVECFSARVHLDGHVAELLDVPEDTCINALNAGVHVITERPGSIRSGSAFWRCSPRRTLTPCSA